MCVQIVDTELDQLSKHLAAMRERLLELLLAADLGEGVRVHGPRDPSLRLPNTLSIGIPGVEARVLLEKVIISEGRRAGKVGGKEHCSCDISSYGMIFADEHPRGRYDTVLRSSRWHSLFGIGTLPVVEIWREGGGRWGIRATDLSHHSDRLSGCHTF